MSECVPSILARGAHRQRDAREHEHIISQERLAEA